MGNSFSTENDLENLKETLRSIQHRLSKLESENALMTKTITNLKVSNNELGRTVSKLHNRVFDTPITDTNRSVRIPKMNRSLYVK